MVLKEVKKIGLLISSVVIAFFALVLLIIGIALKRKGNDFEQNKKCGQAEVVGYTRSKELEDYTLLVRIPKLNDDNLYSCTSGKIDLSHFPKGTIVDVLYAPIKVFGVDVVEVHLIDVPPTDCLTLGLKFKKFSIILFIIACIFAVAGVVTVL